MKSAIAKPTNQQVRQIFSTLLWLSTFILGAYHGAFATHNLAGQISATYTGNNRYDIQITTYTDPAPARVDRCSADLEIWNCSGQLVGTIADIPRANGPLDPSPNPMECPPRVHLGVEVYATVKRNIYNTSFTFPGQGCYIIRYYDLARRKDVTNISDPGIKPFL